MKTRSLTEFVELALDKGFSKDKIHNSLKKAGWDESEVKKITDLYSETNLGIAIPKPSEIATARHFFYYSLMFLAMYMALYNIGVIVFSMIDITFHTAWSSYAEGKIRWSASFAVIFLPIYVLLLTKEKKWVGLQDKSSPSLPKRWLSYATMLVSTFVALTWLAFLLEDFLGGKLTTAVGLKALTVISVSSFVAYFLYGEVNGKSGNKEMSDE